MTGTPAALALSIMSAVPLPPGKAKTTSGFPSRSMAALRIGPALLP
jgi:hypothetical protein